MTADVVSFDGKPMTAREVRIAREAASKVLAFFSVFERTPEGVRAQSAFVSGEFPFPKVTRPRVVCDPQGMKWRAVNGEIEVESERHGWIKPHDSYVFYHPTSGRVRMWADLLNNPTETVDGDA